MRDLEEVAQSFDGVRDAYAINAGREVRVMVNAGRVNDEQAKTLSYEIAQRIRDEMTYPGEVQITVIRQTIATDWAGRPNTKRRPKNNRPRGRGGRRFDRNRGRSDRKSGNRGEGGINGVADHSGGEPVQPTNQNQNPSDN